MNDAFKEIIETGFPGLSDSQKEIMANYGDRHAKIESVNTNDYKEPTLLPVCMQIISKVMEVVPDFNIVEGDGEDFSINISNELDMKSIEDLGMVDVIINMIEAAIINEAVNMILEKIGDSNTIQSNTLIKSISHIAEKTFSPQIYTTVNFNVV